ncbi:MAG TPA: hypothetical protein VMW66_06225 [Elusimicrobiales bacterium]|nr:hypothetical protein [Elusimicrobiales bacterium]
MIELAGLALGFLGKPIANAIGSIFGKKKKPEEIAGALAMGSNPETLPAYVESLAKLRQADTDFFNRDVRGETYAWVNSVRALIRPVVVIGSISGLLFLSETLTPETRAVLSAYIGDWMRARSLS